MPFVVLQLWGTVALATGNAAEVSTTQILHPPPGFKLREGQELEIRIKVEGSSTAVEWELFLERADGEMTSTLQTGSGPVDREVIATITWVQLTKGELYYLVLTATRGVESAVSKSSFRVVDATYSVIPLEEGNLSRSAYHTYTGDAEGNLVLYSGEVADPARLILFDRTTGRRDTVAVATASNEGVRLSPDGSRLFFTGAFPDGSGGSDRGLGFLDLAQRLTMFVGPGGQKFYTVDHTGKRIAYQRALPEGTLQYFLYDEATGEHNELTNAPNAIIYSIDPTFCPQIRATTPLIGPSGSRVVLISSATLGLAPQDDSVGCRIFGYDVTNRTLSLIASLPRSKSIGLPGLSTDGRWLSFSVVRTLPNGIRRGFPGLMDLASGELFDPAVDVGDFTSFDSVITGDGRGLVISTQADLDPHVGNADHNLELFYYDRVSGKLSQVTETTGGVGSSPGGCPAYRPHVNNDGSIMVVGGLLRFDEEFCRLDGPQRKEADGFWFRFFRAVRKRPGNRGPVFERPADVRVVAGDTLTMTFAAEDPDGDLISFFAQLKDGFDVPPGSVITDHYDGTATFRWPTRLEDAGTHVLRVAAFDEGGGEIFHDVTISVVPGGGTPVETATPTDTRTPRSTDTPTVPASTEIPNTVTPAPPTPSAPATTSAPATPTIDATPSVGATPSVSATPAVTCPGDCNGDGEVSIDELVTGVGITINSELLSTCPAFACGSANSVTVDCLLGAVHSALNGCAP